MRNLLFLCGAALIGISLLAQPAPRNDPKLPATPDGAMVGPANWGEVTLPDALVMLERWSGRTVLRPTALPATTIPFSLGQQVTKEEARRALETILTLNGIAVTPLGEKFLKVTPLNTVRGETPELIEGSTLELPPSGRIASKLFQLHFLRASELMPQVSGMLNTNAASAPVVFEKANAALLTDTIANLQRVETLVTKLDQPTLEGLTPKFYKSQHSTASALVTRLQAIFNGPVGTQPGTATSYQADDRTNQIILLSDARQIPVFDELIAKLDTEGESSTRQEVIALKHADATEMATLISSLISGASAARSTAQQTGALQQTFGGRNNNNAAVLNALTNGNRSGLSNRQIANALTAAQNNGNFGGPGGGPGGGNSPGGNNNGGGNAANGNAGGGAAPLVVASTVIPGMSTTAGEVAQQFSPNLTVVSDARSNSLVASGTADDLRLIKDLVEHLDIILAQVRIEVVIAEVNITDASTTGIDSLGLVVQDDRLVGFAASGPGFGISGVSDTYAALADATTGEKSLSGILSLSSTPRKSNANILSAPSIVTTHNKEAEIFVGESRPVISSYQNQGSTITGSTSTVTYKEIGIRLTVKPLIGYDGTVQLDIKQDVSDILGTVSIDGNEQPRIGSRTTESFVTAKSGEIVVLGGLQRKSDTKSANRLGPIPFIGDLFGSRTRDNTRTDLVFFLRPYVLKNSSADNDETFRRLEKSPQKPDLDKALKGESILPKR